MRIQIAKCEQPADYLRLDLDLKPLKRDIKKNGQRESIKVSLTISDSYIGSRWVVIDGWRRVEAMRALKRDYINADIEQIDLFGGDADNGF